MSDIVLPEAFYERKRQLQKMLYAYEYIDKQPRKYKEAAKAAFEENKPESMKRFENHILNSTDVENNFVKEEKKKKKERECLVRFHELGMADSLPTPISRRCVEGNPQDIEQVEVPEPEPEVEIMTKRFTPSPININVPATYSTMERPKHTSTTEIISKDNDVFYRVYFLTTVIIKRSPTPQLQDQSIHLASFNNGQPR